MGVADTLFSTAMPSVTEEGRESSGAFCRLPTMPPANREDVSAGAVFVLPVTVPAL